MSTRYTKCKDAVFIRFFFQINTKKNSIHQTNIVTKMQNAIMNAFYVSLRFLELK